MDSVLDRLRQELDQLGDRVTSAIQQGRLQVEKIRLTSLRKDLAAELGLLVHARERGATSDESRYQALLERLNELQDQLGRVEHALARERGGTIETAAAGSPDPAGESPDAPGVAR